MHSAGQIQFPFHFISFKLFRFHFIVLFNFISSMECVSSISGKIMHIYVVHVLFFIILLNWSNTSLTDKSLKKIVSMIKNG